MALNFGDLEDAAATAIKDEAVNQYPSTPNGPTQESDFEPLADLIAAGIRAAFVYLVANAEVDLKKGTIS